LWVGERKLVKGWERKGHEGTRRERKDPKSSHAPQRRLIKEGPEKGFSVTNEITTKEVLKNHSFDVIPHDCKLLGCQCAIICSPNKSSTGCKTVTEEPLTGSVGCTQYW
jgi:hypothetical protein